MHAAMCRDRHNCAWVCQPSNSLQAAVYPAPRSSQCAAEGRASPGLQLAVFLGQLSRLALHLPHLRHVLPAALQLQQQRLG